MFTLIPDVEQSFDIIAYFKDSIPDEPWLKHQNVRPVVLRPPRFLPSSFSLYFYVYFPIRTLIDGVDVAFIANYMLPILYRGKSIANHDRRCLA